MHHLLIKAITIVDRGASDAGHHQVIAAYTLHGRELPLSFVLSFATFCHMRSLSLTRMLSQKLIMFLLRSVRRLSILLLVVPVDNSQCAEGSGLLEGFLHVTGLVDTVAFLAVKRT